MKALPLTALCLGFFMIIMDATIINVALPIIAQDLHTTIAGLQWVLVGYILTFACFMIKAGYLSDVLGAKCLFLLGMGWFVLTSVGCGLSHTIIMLVAFRFLQGFSAALIMPTSLKLIHHLHDDKALKSKAIGIWGGVGGLAAASGPIAGALLIHFFDWRAVFFVNVPIGLLGLLLAWHAVDAMKPAVKARFDYIGQVLAIVTIAALAFGLIEAGRLGWSNHLVIAGCVLALIAAMLFLLTENHVKQPMLPLTLFRQKAFVVALVVGVVMNVSFYGELFLLPLYFQQLRHYTIVMTGFALLPIVMMIAVSSYASGKIVAKIGAKKPMVMGLVIGAVGFLSLLVLGEHGPHYALLIVPFLLMGVGISFTMPAATLTIMHAVAPHQTGIAAGAFNTSRQLGSLIGVAVFGTIVAGASSFVAGIHITLCLAAVLYAFTSLLVSLALKVS